MLKLVALALFFLGMLLMTASQFLFLVILSEINARRPAGQRFSLIDMAFMTRFTRRERTRIIMRVHKDLFPNSQKRDAFDNTRFFGALSGFSGLILVIIAHSF